MSSLTSNIWSSSRSVSCLRHRSFVKGIRISTKILFWDMDQGHSNTLDGHSKTYVVTDTATRSSSDYRHRPRLAVTSRRTLRSRTATKNEQMLEVTRRRRERVYSELSGKGVRTRLTELTAEEESRWNAKTLRLSPRCSILVHSRNLLSFRVESLHPLTERTTHV